MERERFLGLCLYFLMNGRRGLGAEAGVVGECDVEM